MDSWTTDLKHITNEDNDDVAPEARERARFSRDVVEAATSRAVKGRWQTAVPCIAKVDGKPCGGRIEVSHVDGGDEMEWSCLACGERGVVTGFTGSWSDLSQYRIQGRKKIRHWGYEEEERVLLWEATRKIPELRAVIARATPRAEFPGVYFLDATVEELDDVYTLIEKLTVGTRSRRRRDLLDGLRATLCTAMDGF